MTVVVGASVIEGHDSREGFHRPPEDGKQQEGAAIGDCTGYKGVDDAHEDAGSQDPEVKIIQSQKERIPRMPPASIPPRSSRDSL